MATTNTQPTPICKRGLCYPTSTLTPLHPFTKPGSLISWLYNWAPTPHAPILSSRVLQFVPMQWNHVNISSLPDHCFHGGASYLLGFNEPELQDQSNMPVELAVKEWLENIEPLRKRGIRCGSPGISSGPAGIPWLQQFLKKIRSAGSDVDFYALHWYGQGLGSFYDYLWSAYYQLGADRPVWVTEFACTNWNEREPLGKEEVEVFLRESCRYLDGLEWVERYAWFGDMGKGEMGNVGRWAALTDGAGGLTVAGRFYRDGE